uniref:Sigma factor n=1 Tax=Erodium gruinum TaxID=337380 RepID=A0A0G2STS8_9ROSI|nr:sigma factor [Erodium gruinum]
MSCLVPQFKCQPDTFAINFRAPLSKIRGPIHFQARCVLSTMSAPTSTSTVLEAEKLQISSLEAHSNSVSAKSPWTHMESIDPSTKANLEASLVKETLLSSDETVITASAAEATLVKETLLTSDEAVITASGAEATLVKETLLTSDEAVITASAAEAIALAKAAATMAKNAKALMVKVPPGASSIQSSWVKLNETEEDQTKLFEDSTDDEDDELEPMEEELKLLEEQLSNAVAVRSTRQTERRARREKAAAKAAANVVPAKPRSTRRKKRASKAINHADPLRHVRRKSKLLTGAEERVLSAGIQDLVKLEMLQRELAERCGCEPTFAQWAAAAGLDQRVMQSLITYGASCKEKMITSNIRLVVSIAKQYTGIGVDIEDLIQDGCIGLIKAVEKFDGSRGCKFSTYAHWWVRQALRKGLNQKATFAHIPAHIVNAAYKVKKVKEQFKSENKREPNNAELAEATGFTLKKISLVKRIPKLMYINQKSDENFLNVSEMADPDQESEESVTMKEYLMQDVEAILDTLNPREARVIRLRHGLIDGRPLGLQEIGQLMSLSRERIRQIESDALRNMKSKKKFRDLEMYQYKLDDS